MQQTSSLTFLELYSIKNVMFCCFSVVERERVESRGPSHAMHICLSALAESLSGTYMVSCMQLLDDVTS